MPKSHNNGFNVHSSKEFKTKHLNSINNNMQLDKFQAHSKLFSIKKLLWTRQTTFQVHGSRVPTCTWFKRKVLYKREIQTNKTAIWNRKNCDLNFKVKKSHMVKITRCQICAFHWCLKPYGTSLWLVDVGCYEIEKQKNLRKVRRYSEPMVKVAPICCL